MRSGLVIRDELQADRVAIRTITLEAFRTMPFAAGDEHELIDTLRDSGALVVSLVAELEGEVIGHIAFSPATSTDGSSGCYALGPVSVHPSFQREGIGNALVRRGLERLQHRDARVCILTGNPDYYRRFGFQVSPEHAPASEPAEYFMLKPMGASIPDGPIHFHPAFQTAT